MKSYYSHGKLLLTGEYVVLDGAFSLAIPTKFGQDLTVKPLEASKLYWNSFDENNSNWFEAEFDLSHQNISCNKNNDEKVSERLLQILKAAQSLNPKFLSNRQGFEITTQLEFPKNWGLGTSSTLIHNISNWANINPYSLLDLTFGGSGYDIACAEAKQPKTYQILLDGKKDIKSVNFNPSFKSSLYFVHLNQKQNSRDGIAKYRSNGSDLKIDIEYINRITQDMIDCDSLEHFQQLIDRHEQIISKIIKQKPVKELLFNDFNGSIKSLGAWGGDFVLVASQNNPSSYFKDQGFSTIIDYEDMILK
ncbi:GYDIA family GHMP kinase [Psychroserpens jangbogonensis]|uniref:GYDIA family GHMP kinase n=1 Tax=Psychroserpens jangbogonensis TaxID=1484460 RepID=UPI00053E8B67|nr:GYDIA family GHMP kinase [Psychroserpens jangbogonensis]